MVDQHQFYAILRNSNANCAHTDAADQSVDETKTHFYALNRAFPYKHIVSGISKTYRDLP